ncbi:MAG: hypothetical protein ACOCXX_01635, partial [Planctomycetota bacterium]
MEHRTLNMEHGTNPMNITFPRHGAVLCHADGHEDTDGLTVTVEGTADPLARVGVDGVPARRDASRFTAD